jgi:enterochelin esterase family protein
MEVLGMKIFLISLLLCASAKLVAAPLEVRTGLTISPEQQVKEGVPQGKLSGPFEFHSTILKDTVRRYWLYVPAQYVKTEAASVLVFQDGQRATNPKGSLRITNVMNNLIASGDMPTTIGIFITPGNKSKHYPDNLGMSNPNHRAPEYDAMNDSYARFVIEEMLPHVAKQYNLTNDPEQRAIGGTSSGAIAAFTAAWHKPDYFRKVYSAIGSYVSIGFRPNAKPVKLGGQDYPAMIRREPIRPIKMFMQDGVNDLDNEWGNWFLANQQMLSALNYANRTADKKGVKGPRYQVTHVWTDGEHNDKHAGMLLPEGLRWLWSE